MSGRNSKHTASDTLHKKLYVECKKHKRMAIHTLYRKTKELADKEKKIPVVITRETGKKITLVTARIEHLEEVIKFLKENEDETTKE